jgi:multidrug efflux system outer membrane protein
LLAVGGAARCDHHSGSDGCGAHFQLRDLDNRLEISQRTLASRQATLELMHAIQPGIVPSSTRQAEIERRRRWRPCRRSSAVSAVENALAVLLGGPPGPIPRGAPLSDGI